VRKRYPQQPLRPPSYRLRFYLIVILLIIAALGLVWRLVDLTLVKRAFLQGQGDARTLRTVAVPAYRGMILDRFGEPLAISTPVISVWANPTEFTASPRDLTRLANLLGLTKMELQRRITLGNAADREFVYLKRGVDPSLGDAIKKLGLSGVYYQSEYRRYYPEAEVAAHVLGFTNIDDQGQEGLELAYNQWLGGSAGLKRVLKDRFGHTVAELNVIKPPRPGHNLQLALDRRLQYFAYRELQAGINQYQADSGSVVVLDTTTGEILAMVNSPAYNPNSRPAKRDGRYRNRAVTDIFEPGSTIKPFGMAAALASGKYRPTSEIDTSPGWMIIDGKRVKDEHDNGVIDLTKILEVSSNMGMAKITLSLPPHSLWNMLHAVGFGQVTDSGFPGARSGVLVNYPTSQAFVLATMWFGYAMSVTPLQLAQAYAVLAAQGIKRPVSLLRQDKPVAGQQVMDPKVAQEILVMLESVLTKQGTAPLARVPGYHITGKTGTAHMVGPQGYIRNRYNSIFVGIAPVSQPRLVVAVVLHDPRGKQYYGGYTSGLIFSHIMGEALRLLNIPPDDPDSLSAPSVTIATPPPNMAD